MFWLTNKSFSIFLLSGSFKQLWGIVPLIWYSSSSLHLANSHLYSSIWTYSLFVFFFRRADGRPESENDRRQCPFKIGVFVVIRGWLWEWISVVVEERGWSFQLHQWCWAAADVGRSSDWDSWSYRGCNFELLINSRKRRSWGERSGLCPPKIFDQFLLEFFAETKCFRGCNSMAWRRVHLAVIEKRKEKRII